MKVTIITACKNADRTIQKTISSVHSQSYRDIEYIVVDGNSTDGTIGILKRNAPHVSKIIKAKDNSVYQAMNRGLAHATGSIVHFLNSGDYFADTTVLARIVKAFHLTSADILYGDARIIEAGKIQFVKRHASKLGYFLYKDTITHQALFAKRQVFERYGNFNETYRVLADLEWEVRMMVYHHVPAHYENIPVVYYQRGGLSEKTDETSLELRMNERNRVRDMYYPQWQKVFFTGALGVEYAMHEIKNSIIKRRRLHTR